MALANTAPLVAILQTNMMPLNEYASALEVESSVISKRESETSKLSILNQNEL